MSLSHVLEEDTYVTAPDGSVEGTEERFVTRHREGMGGGDVGDRGGGKGEDELRVGRERRGVRARALIKLNEANAVLLEAGDLAGVRAVHSAMGALLAEVAEVEEEGVLRSPEASGRWGAPEVGASVVDLDAERARRNR
ncbi:MAG: hypothetical protein U0441_32765 [Polyangiaceae bacterium]